MSASRISATPSGGGDIIPIGPNVGSSVVDDVPGMCETHDDEAMKMFCLDCKVMLCALCYIEKHTTHKFLRLNEVRTKIEEDVRSLCDGIESCRNLESVISEDLTNFKHAIEDIEKEVTRLADERKEKIEQDKEQLLAKLRITKESQQQQSSHLVSKVQERSSNMAGMKLHLESVLTTASTCDLMRNMTPWNRSVNDWVQLDVLQSAVTDLASNKVDFIPTTPGGNIIGKISAQVKNATENGRLRHVFRKGHPVGGVTALGDRIYVVRCRNNERIEVFNADTFAAEGLLTVPGLSSLPWCLASCSINGCLYVCDDCNAVHRVDLPQFNNPSSVPTKTRWSVGSTPTGVSVNRVGNIIVSCYGIGRLQEYKRDGQLVREIQLRNEMKNPLHAVQLANGMFLVCYGQWDVAYKVGVVTLDGKCIGALRNSDDRQVTQLYGSSAAVVARGGTTIVCEWNDGQRRGGTDRVLALNKSLSGLRDLLVTVDGGLDQPWAICLDESRDRLYIGEQSGGRVLVFENVLMKQSSAPDNVSTSNGDKNGATRIA